MDKKTKELISYLIEGYYKYKDNGAGGNLHIVLEDENYDSDSVDFCIKRCEKENDIWGKTIGTLLLKADQEDRKNIIENNYNYRQLL